MPGPRLISVAAIARLSRGRDPVAGLGGDAGGLPPQPERVVADVAAHRGAGGIVECRDPGRGVVGEGRRLLETTLRLRGQAPQERQRRQQQRQPVGVGAQIGPARGPGEPGAQVVGNQIERTAPGAVATPSLDVVLDAFVGPLDQLLGCCHTPAHLPGPHLLELANLVQLVDAVLANRLQHAVAGLGAGSGDGETVVGQPGEPVRQARVDRHEASHLGGGLDRERRREHRHPSQQRLFVRLEQGIAPVDRGAQGAVPLVEARAARQHPQRVGQSRLHAVEPQRGEASGGQLDGEGHAVERPAHAGDAGHVARARLEPGARASPLEEQRHRVGALVLVGLQRQPRNREDVLERQHEAGATGGQNPGLRAGGQKALHEDGDPVDQVLTVVEHDQRLRPAEAGQDRVIDGAARTLRHAEDRGHGGRHHPGIGDRDQVDEPDRVGGLDRLGGDRDGEPCLAYAPGTDGGDEPVPGDGRAQCLPLGHPAHEGRERGRDRRHRGPGRGQGCGERAAESLRVRRLCRGERGGVAGELAAVGDPELAEQRRHVALDRAHRYVQASGDLGVGEVLRDAGQHVGLTGRHAGVGQDLSIHHPRIVPGSGTSHDPLIGRAQSPRCSAATRLGTTMRHASSTISRISMSSIASSRTTTQL